jgi:hypothetical protein
LRKRVHIIGQRGRWLAEVEGQMLPVLHHSWRRGPNEYFDPMSDAKIDGAQYTEFVAALRGGTQAVIQKDAKGSLDRDGYVGVFSYRDLDIGTDGSIRLIVTDRIADPSN